MNNYKLTDLIDFVTYLPGVGSRAARKIAIAMIKNKTRLMDGFVSILNDISKSIQECSICKNFDICNPCGICSSRQNVKQICIVADIDDLWNIEKSAAYHGLYYVLGGYLSTTNATLPSDLAIDKLFKMIENIKPEEIIFALGSTIQAQTTYYYVIEGLENFLKTQNLTTKITSLAFGIPMGSEIDYIDEVTISEAIRSRK